jgi:hypothetical protein
LCAHLRRSIQRSHSCPRCHRRSNFLCWTSRLALCHCYRGLHGPGYQFSPCFALWSTHG